MADRFPPNIQPYVMNRVKALTWALMPREELEFLRDELLPYVQERVAELEEDKELHLTEKEGPRDE